MFAFRVKNISASCLIAESDLLLLGTENAHIYTVDLKAFKFLDQVIYQETVMQKLVTMKFHDFRYSEIQDLLFSLCMQMHMFLFCYAIMGCMLHIGFLIPSPDAMSLTFVKNDR